MLKGLQRGTEARQIWFLFTQCLYLPCGSHDAGTLTSGAHAQPERKMAVPVV